MSVGPGTLGRRGRWGVGIGAALLVAATGLTFGPATVGDFIWDDRQLIVFNDAVRESGSLTDVLTRRFWDVSDEPDGQHERRRYYRPVVILAYATQLRIFGDDPLGFHLVNLALHGTCVLLAYAWLRRRFGRTGVAGSLAAALGAALFALHPSRPESVSWISGSTDLWMALFALSGLLLWSRARGLPGRFLAFAAFILAMLAKEPAVAVPVALAAEAWLRRSEEGGSWRRALVLAVAVVAAFGVRLALIPQAPTFPHDRGAAMAVARVLSALGHSVARVAWPWPPTAQAAVLRLDEEYLALYEPWSIGLGAAAALGLLVLGFGAWRRRRVRPWLGDVIWFLVPLLPTLQISPLGLNVLVADRFLYLPMLGVAAMLGRALLPVLAAGARRVAVLGAASCALLAYAGISLWHSGHFLTEDTLWTYEYGLNARNDYVIDHLAQVRARQGRFDEATDMLRTAHRAARERGHEVSAAQHAFHAVAVRLQHWPAADQQALLALRAFLDAAADPGRSRAAVQAAGLDLHVDLVVARRFGLFSRGRLLSTPRAHAYLRTFELRQAERLARAVVDKEPASWNARIVLARSLAWQERWDEALAAFDRGAAKVLHEPSTKGLRAQLVAARAAAKRRSGQGPIDEALGRAEGLIVMGATAPARRLLDAALRDDPDRPEAWLLLAVADASDGLRDRARERIEEARRRFPDRRAMWDRALVEIEPR